MKSPEKVQGWKGTKKADGDETSSTSDVDFRPPPPPPPFLSPEAAGDGFRNGNGAGAASGNGNGDGKPEQTGHRRHGTRSGHGSAGSDDTMVSGRGSIEQQMPASMRGDNHGHRNHKDYGEVTEFDIREDLKSWVVFDRGVDGAVKGPKDRRIDPALLVLQGM